VQSCGYRKGYRPLRASSCFLFLSLDLLRFLSIASEQWRKNQKDENERASKSRMLERSSSGELLHPLFPVQGQLPATTALDVDSNLQCSFSFSPSLSLSPFVTFSSVEYKAIKWTTMRREKFYNQAQTSQSCRNDAQSAYSCFSHFSRRGWRWLTVGGWRWLAVDLLDGGALLCSLHRTRLGYNKSRDINI